MKVKNATIRLSTRGNTDIHDLTDRVTEELRASGMTDGNVTIFVQGSTGGVTTVEFEEGLVRDLREAFERLASSDREYHHDRRWHDGNGHSHVRASLLGPSLTIPFAGGKLLLGTWQQAVFVDFDNRPREREIILHFIGT